MMPTHHRVRNSEKGQSSVQYTLLVALVVLAVVGFAKGYHASLDGVTGTALSWLAAAQRTLPPAATPSAGGSELRGRGLSSTKDQSYGRAEKTELPWEGVVSGQSASR
jgi:hypothetical protein